MDMTPVVSSNVVSVGYDPTTNTIAITFKGGEGPDKTYEYADISPETYQALLQASSKGKFIKGNIIK